VSDLPQDSVGPGDRPEPGRGSLSLGGVAVFLLVDRAMRKQQRNEDPDAPDSVRTDDRAKAIFARARDLVREGREDRAAVNELRALAGRHRRSLRRAEELSRLSGRHLEQRFANDMHRLLAAALSGRPVEPIAAADAERCEILGRVFAQSRPREDTWRDLVAREPQLAALEAEVRAGRFGVQHDTSRVTREQVDDPEWRHVRGEQARLSLKLTDEVKRLAGPTSISSDPVIKSRMARDIATSYVKGVRPHDLTPRAGTSTSD
jgi:hypothetical protein